MTLAPLLSEADPAVSTEGAIDPLGLYAIADAMGVKLVPGVRERQVRLRFLTVIAASLAVCSEFDPDELAADDVSEPWQVFEWYVVEGLVRAGDESTDLRALPGVDKARKAKRDKVPLSARRFLKTPRVFGLHGVYRQLARSIEVETADHLGDTGLDLLQTWSDEQGLHGFHGTGQGPGRVMREKLVSAVTDGLKQGAVTRSVGWRGWQLIRDHLAPGEIGQREGDLLAEALVRDTAGFRRPVFELLTSIPGQEAWQANGSERDVHELLRDACDADLAEHLDAILAYERWSRLLDNAFNDCLCRMTRRGTKTSVKELAQLRFVMRACESTANLFAEVVTKLEPTGQTARFQSAFAPFADQLDPMEWVDGLLEHHRRIQQQKPPNGKNAWFERFDDGSVAVRPAYRRIDEERDEHRYVHGYRTSPLWSFATDLRLVGHG